MRLAATRSWIRLWGGAESLRSAGVCGGGTEKEQQGRMCREPDRLLHVWFLQPRGLFLVLAIYTRQRRCRQSGPYQARRAGASSAGAVRMGLTCSQMHLCGG